MKSFFYKTFVGATFVACMFSCDTVSDVLSGDTDIVTGLKSALKVGIDTAAHNLSQQGGYLNDVAVKIGIPDEVATTFSAVQTISKNNYINTALEATNSSIPDEETFVELFNSAAEDAAPKSVDVFTSAITDMTVADGEEILFSDNDQAATDYLNTHTYTQLQAAFNPSITTSLNSVKVAGYTSTTAWTEFATYNNKAASYISEYSSVLKLANVTGALPDNVYASVSKVQTVNTDLSDYITGKALDGLFVKVADKEYDIRHNVNARINDVLKKVFGKYDTYVSTGTKS